MRPTKKHVIFILITSLLNACYTPHYTLPETHPSIPPNKSFPSPPLSMPTPNVPTNRSILPSKIAQSSHLKAVSWQSVEGWGTESIGEALQTFVKSCSVLNQQIEWQAVCQKAQLETTSNPRSSRSFFENNFIPYQVIGKDSSNEGLLTGYYEPLLHGSRIATPLYRYPLYALPPDLVIHSQRSATDASLEKTRGRWQNGQLVPYYTRGEINQLGSLFNANVLFWVDDPIDLFFLHVQGSGRVQLPDNTTIRVTFAEKNGHPYQSIGTYLINKGELKADQASMNSIKNWARRHPLRLNELLAANPSYIFFREAPLGDPNDGPMGAMGISITPERSIAVDPQFIPLGSPVFLSAYAHKSDFSLQRLTIAQDTGSAIRGSIRADYFMGYDARAGEKAGKLKHKLRMWLLLPKPHNL